MFQTSLLSESCLGNRGPDVQNVEGVDLTTGLKSYWVGCTLHFRGSFTPQPLTDQHGNILLWNAEIFGGVEVGYINYFGNNHY